MASDTGPEITAALFAEWRAPRFGTSNPDCLTNPVWNWLVRSERSAYAASQHFGFAAGENREPGWSFARFGMSTTALTDGRTIHIAGEHEDAYDPDFHIYNDVIVRNADGSIEILGYPREVFPPTDFHSATVLRDRIIIVGSLGYPADRAAETTQVAELDLGTFSIALRPTSGAPPGWIHRHSAVLDRNSIVVSGGLVATGDRARALRDNGDDWRLDLASWRWKRLTDRRWRQWQLTRADGHMNQLFRLRSLSRFHGRRWAPEHRESMEAMIEGERAAVRAAYGGDPDLASYGTLYVPPVAHDVLPARDDELGVHRIRVSGIVVRYVESPMSLKLVIEGALPEATTATLVEDLRHKLSLVERTEYDVREIGGN
ncbi:MAG: hypothetical protein ABI889_12810 [Gemmatimonadota bacterium]